MTRRLHPATKLLLAVGRAEYQEACVLRHVKPLLDALDTFGHSLFHHDEPDMKTCEVCRLLAAWKEPLK